ncbi:MAG TPA: glycosyltransferase [bacterium]|nr:glycosyltransferase [bacterium]HPN29762.1 glycosyltransferase [bacterium]
MIIFRLNISGQFGTGHLFRCLSLYKNIRIPTAEKTLMIKSGQKYLKKFVERLEKINYVKFSKSSEENLLLKKILKKKESGKNAIILDIKNTTVNYIKRIRRFGLKIITFDDLGKGGDYADLLIDANIHKTGDNRKLYGEKYILLNPVYQKFHLKPKKINKQIKKIVLFFGGTDPAGIAEHIIKNIEYLKFKDCEITVITPYKTNIENKNAENLMKYKNIMILNVNLAPEKLAELYFNSDLAIISGGITLYEIMCLGTPCIVINQSGEQYRNSKFYNKCFINAAVFDKNASIDILNEKYYEICDYKKRMKLSRASKAMIDGLGLKRITDAALEFFK